MRELSNGTPRREKASTNERTFGGIGKTTPVVGGTCGMGKAEFETYPKKPTSEDAMTLVDSNNQRDSKGHSVACSNREFDFFYRGLEEHKLLVQKCTRCGALRNPPGPACGACHSLEWVPSELCGSGTIFSYTVHFHPALPGFEVPHPIALVEMDEGVRMVGAMDCAHEPLKIGMRVHAAFLRRGAVAGFRFCIGQPDGESAATSDR